MAINDYEESEGREGGSRSGARRASSASRPRSGSSSSGASDVWRAATAGLSSGAIMDIVERLGLVDMIVDRLKQRVEDVDIDEIIDEVADYLKRNPEVLVVSLGAVTIAAGALVYLNRRRDRNENEPRSTGSGTKSGSKKRV
jgi:hypothetical protein